MTSTYEFKNNDEFLDVLHKRNDPNNFYDKWIDKLSLGENIRISVENFPDRALILKSKLEVMDGEKLPGADIYVIDFESN